MSRGLVGGGFGVYGLGRLGFRAEVWRFRELVQVKALEGFGALGGGESFGVVI